MSLRDRLNVDGESIYVKDLSMMKEYVPGNPFSRMDPDTGQRKYCSESLFESAKQKFVIPNDGNEPKPLVECEECGCDSYRTHDNECGRCGCPMFDCPGCGDEVHGKPGVCPHCDAEYEWEA